MIKSEAVDEVNTADEKVEFILMLPHELFRAFKITDFESEPELYRKVSFLRDTLNKSGFRRKKSWIYGLFLRENNLKSAFP